MRDAHKKNQARKDDAWEGCDILHRLASEAYSAKVTG